MRSALSGSSGPPRRRRSEIPHGTTCVAVRYDSGVVLAGDRRATVGAPDQQPPHREGVPRRPAFRCGHRRRGRTLGTEMVRLFQLQLEHYEKVEGTPISLEGKANQLGQMVRANLPAAMQGLVVVPIFAGFDTAAVQGPAVRVRRHRRALRGARPRSHRVGLAARRHRGEAGLPSVDGAGRGRGPGAGRAVRGLRRRLGHRGSRPGARRVPRGGGDRRRPATSASRTPSCAGAPSGCCAATAPAARAKRGASHDHVCERHTQDDPR